MFTVEEARALASAVQLAQQWLDPELAASSEAALSRVLSVLPVDVREQTHSLNIVVPPSGLSDSVRTSMQLLRRASQAKHKIRVEYRDATENRSERVLRRWPCFTGEGFGRWLHGVRHGKAFETFALTALKA